MTDDLTPINSPIPAVPVPAIAIEHRTDMVVREIGRPPGVAEEDCTSVQALVGSVNGMPAYVDYFQPNQEQLARLNAGGFFELVQLSPAMVMHSVSVWPASAAADDPQARADRMDPTEHELTVAVDAAAKVLHGDVTQEPWDDLTPLEQLEVRETVLPCIWAALRALPDRRAALLAEQAAVADAQAVD